jgi:hypothetical protein
VSGRYCQNIFWQTAETLQKTLIRQAEEDKDANNQPKTKQGLRDLQALARGRQSEIQKRRHWLRVRKCQWKVHDKKLRPLCLPKRQLLQRLCVLCRSGKAGMRRKIWQRS